MPISTDALYAYHQTLMSQGHALIQPFTPELILAVAPVGILGDMLQEYHENAVMQDMKPRRPRRIIPYGATGSTYIMRLGYELERHSRMVVGGLMDPLETVATAKPIRDGIPAPEKGALRPEGQDFLTLPANSYAYGESLEQIYLPPRTADFPLWGMGTEVEAYRRIGVTVHVGILTPGYQGPVGLYITNHSLASVRLYPGQGIVELAFFRLED